MPGDEANATVRSLGGVGRALPNAQAQMPVLQAPVHRERRLRKLRFAGWTRGGALERRAVMNFLVSRAKC